MLEPSDPTQPDSLPPDSLPPDSLPPDALETDSEAAPDERIGVGTAIFLGACFTVGSYWLTTMIARGEGASVHPTAVGAIRLLAWIAPWLLVLHLAVNHFVRGKPSRWLSLGFGLLVPYVLVAGCSAVPGWVERMQRRPFDAQAWRVATALDELQNRGGERLRMIDDLLDSGRLDRLTKDEVLTLLGPDDGPEGTGFLGRRLGGFDAQYYLGPERVLGMDHEWLVIDFDATGRVASYRIFTG